jgi:vancomycin permeability regulator SanA
MLKRGIKFFAFFYPIVFVFLISGCNVYYNAFYSDPKKCFLVACEKKPYDVIIIPGYPSDSEMVNGIIEERLNWAYFLYKNGYKKNIIFSVSALYSPYIEAEVMRLYTLQLGVNSNDIFLETKAEHTT